MEEEILAKEAELQELWDKEEKIESLPFVCGVYWTVYKSANNVLLYRIAGRYAKRNITVKS